MVKFKIFLLIFILSVILIYGEESKAITIKEKPIYHSTIVLLASLPLTITYSLLSYKFYKMYKESNPSYNLNKKETKNTFYMGISLSMVYAIVDYINYKKKIKKYAIKSRKGKHSP